MRSSSALWAAVVFAYSVGAAVPAAGAEGSLETSNVREWKVSCNGGPQSIAIAPNGRVFIAATFANQILAFDPANGATETWQLPSGTLPRTLAVDASGRVYFAAIGGAIGRLDPQSGDVLRYPIEGPGTPYWVEIARSGRVWFSDPAGRRIGAFDPDSGDTVFFDIGARPYAIAIDGAERIWTVLREDDSVGVLNPRTGLFHRIKVGTGARPSAIAAAPDGTIWSLLAGAAVLIRIDGPRLREIAEYRAPANLGAPSSLAIGGDGTVWVSFKGEERVWKVDRASHTLEVVNARTPTHAPRPMTVDRGGRVWFVSVERGTLGRLW